MFPFFLPTLEYRNKTWSWYNFIQEVRRDAIRVIFANTGALFREKIFPKKRNTELRQGSHTSFQTLDTDGSTDTGSLKSKKSNLGNFFKRKRIKTAECTSTETSISSNYRRAKSEESMLTSPAPSQDDQIASTHLAELHYKGRQLFGKFYPVL